MTRAQPPLATHHTLSYVQNYAVCVSVGLQVDPDKPVLVAGDPERVHEHTVEKEGGIWYHDNLIAAVVRLCVVHCSQTSLIQAPWD